MNYVQIGPLLERLSLWGLIFHQKTNSFDICPQDFIYMLILTFTFRLIK